MKLEIIESSDKLIINQKWFHTGWFILLLFSSLMLLYLTYFIYKQKESTTLSIFLFILLLLSFLVNTYCLLTKFNTTTLQLTNTDITIRHHPIPWLNRSAKTNEIQKIEIKARKKSVGRTTASSYITIYSIQAYKKSGGTLTLLTFTPVQYYTYNDVKNIYQKINHFLIRRL